MVTKRPLITDDNIATAMHVLKLTLDTQLKRKGKLCWLSAHEMLGVITEEYHELIDAVKSNLDFDIKRELLDVAVAALFALACINNGVLNRGK